MRKTVLLMPLLMLSLAAFSGCSASERVHDKSYLQSASIEGTDKKTLTLSFYGEDSVVTGIGESIDSAKHDAELQLGKEIFTGYTELLILDNAENTERLEYMLNEWRVPPSCIIATGNGSELLKSVSAEKLIGSVKQAKEKSACDIVTVLSKLLHSEPAQTAELSERGFAGMRTVNAQF